MSRGDLSLFEGLNSDVAQKSSFQSLGNWSMIFQEKDGFIFL